MTVCAAAICKLQGRDLVLGISDRMMTSGDIEFESGQTKIYAFGILKAVCLGASDTEAHYAIATATHRMIDEKKVKTVKEAAYSYSQNFAARRRELAELKYLAPLGLDAKSFTSERKTMEPFIASRLTKQMQSEQLDIQAIVAGMDSDDPHEPHLYLVYDPGQVVICDRQGFCAVGTGRRQFETEFMFKGYTRDWSWEKALILMYSAKKRAEFSPGVGRYTDFLRSIEVGSVRFQKHSSGNLTTCSQILKP